MIKIYGMPSCPDCSFVERQAEGRAGIPCFVLEDGRVTLVPEEAGLKSRGADAADTGSASSDPSGIGPSAGFDEGVACSLDGKGC